MLQNLIFLIAAVLFAFAENRNDGTMYKVCSKGRPMLENLSAKEITVQVLTADSIRFAVDGQIYSAVKVPEGNFLQGGSGEFSSYYCIFVDDNSFVAYQDRQYSYYHADASIANQPDAARCQYENVGDQKLRILRVVRNAMVRQDKPKKSELKTKQAGWGKTRLAENLLRHKRQRRV